MKQVKNIIINCNGLICYANAFFKVFGELQLTVVIHLFVRKRTTCYAG